MELVIPFQQVFSRRPTLQVRAPGRVNLLGEHVDYNDGMVLPVALDRAVYLVAAPTEDQIIQHDRTVPRRDQLTHTMATDVTRSSDD